MGLRAGSPLPIFDKNECEKLRNKMTDENKSHGKKPAPDRTEALRRLPREVMRRLTKEEVHAFLFNEVWPDSLQEKLKDYLAEEE